MKASARRIAEFREVTNKIVSMLSEKSISVTQAGVKAFVSYNTDGTVKSVNIPCIPDDADDSILDAIRGYVDHEVASVLFTDPGKTAKRVYGTSPEFKQINALYDVIESTRIEREMRKRFPGSGGNLSNMFNLVAEKSIRPALSTGKSPLPLLMMPALRALAGEHAPQEFLDSVNAESLIGEEMKMIAPFAERLKNVTTTEESAKLASRILDTLNGKNVPEDEGEGEDGEGEESDKKDGRKKDGKPKKNDKNKEKKEDEKKDKKDKGDKSEDKDKKSEKDKGDESDDEGEGDDSDKGDKSDEDGDQGDEEGEDGDDGEGDGDEEGDSDGDSDGDDADGDRSDDSAPARKGEVVNNIKNSLNQMGGANKSLADIITNMIKSDVTPGTYLPFTTDHDKYTVVKVQRGNEAAVDKQIIKSDEKMRGMIGQLQAQMRRLFAQKDFSVNYGGQRKGRLQSNALHRVTMGDDRVFFRREEHEAQDTAITLLLDLSGSMMGGTRTSGGVSKLTIAAETAYTMTQILDRLGISCEVLGFTTGSSAYGATSARHEAENRTVNFTRTEPIEMYVFKTFEEKLTHPIRQRFVGTAMNGMDDHYGTVVNVNSASNIDGESVMMAARRLLKRQEQRKILMVLSDGAPAGGGTGLEAHLKQTVKDVEAMRIETIGIGIADTNVTKYYPKHCVVNSVEKLPEIVTGEMRKLLLQK